MDYSSLLRLVRYVFPNFTDRALDVLSAAQQNAAEANDRHVSPEHVLLAIANVQQGVGSVALERLGVDLRRQVKELEALVRATASKPHEDLPPSFSPETERLLAAARAEAKELGHNYVGTEHLVVGLLRCEGPASEYLQRGGLTAAQLRVQILQLLAR